MMNNNRVKIRFTPDGTECGYISFNLEQYTPSLVALIMNESARGACLVFNRKLIPSQVLIEEGVPLFVKIGSLEPEHVVIKWAKFLDNELVKIGIEREE